MFRRTRWSRHSVKLLTKSLSSVLVNSSAEAISSLTSFPCLGSVFRMHLERSERISRANRNKGNCHHVENFNSEQTNYLKRRKTRFIKFGLIWVRYLIDRAGGASSLSQSQGAAKQNKGNCRSLSALNRKNWHMWHFLYAETCQGNAYWMCPSTRRLPNLYGQL